MRLLLFLVFIYGISMASNRGLLCKDSLKPKKIVFNLSYGFNINHPSILTGSEREILTQTKNTFNSSSHHYNTKFTSPFISLGIEKRNKNCGSKTKIGLMYARIYHGIYNENDETITRIDTFKSSKSNETIFVDSVWQVRNQLYFYSKMLLLNYEIIKERLLTKHLSVFGGLGLTGGISLKTQTEILQTENLYNEYKFKNEQYGYVRNSVAKTNVQIYKTERSSIMGVGIPLGVYRTINSNKKFFNRLAVYVELKPVINLCFNANYPTFIKLNTFIGLGIKRMI